MGNIIHVFGRAVAGNSITRFRPRSGRKPLACFISAYHGHPTVTPPWVGESLGVAPEESNDFRAARANIKMILRGL